ncbi:MAG: Crp/Fnr family transcriptional regulator [Polaribacter sp.]
MDDQKILIDDLKDAFLSDKELETILSGYQKVLIKKNEYILKQDKVCDAYYFVSEGFLRSYAIDYNGNEVTTNFFSKTDLILEETSFFLRIPSKENIQAIEDCVLWKKNFDVFDIHFNSFDKYREWGRAHLVKNFFALKQRSLSMITETAKERYKNLLYEHPNIVQQASLKHIASYLGVTDTSLSRIRKEIVKK